MSDHHRWMIRSSLKHLAFLEQALLELDEQIVRQIQTTGMQPALLLLESLPGVQQDSAVSILAEVGPDMSPFPSSAHLSSWAAIVAVGHTLLVLVVFVDCKIWLKVIDSLSLPFA